MSTALIAKCSSVAIIFIGSLFCGLLPAFRVFAGFPRYALSLTLSYGGGILIATSLVHILPEARHSWPEDWSFTAEMSLCLGIFIVYIVEEIAHFLVCHDLHSPLGHAGEDDGHNHGVHVHHDEPPNRCDEPAAVYLFAEEKTRSGEHGQSLNQNSAHGGKCDHQNVEVGESEETHHSHDHSHHFHSHHHHSPQKHNGQGDQTVTDKLFPLTPEPKVNNEPIILSKVDRKTAARLRSLVGLVALSIHAGLEGLSVGLGSDAQDVWYLCGAVAAHKFVIAFCLGMEVRNASANSCSLVQTSSSASFKFRYVLFFALMTPLGIAIGTIITEITNSTDSTEAQSALVAILQTLASGTLLYVAFFEVILRERARFSGKGLTQLVFVILGWLTMVLVEVFYGHDHDEHEHAISTTTMSSISNLTIT